MLYIPYESPESSYSILLWQRAWLTLKDSHALENKCMSFFTKINLTLTKVKVFQFSFKISITTIQTFQKRYITFLYLKGVKRYQPSKFEKCKISPIYLIKRRVFYALELWWLVSFEPLEVQKRYIPPLKGLNSGFWK